MKSEIFFLILVFQLISCDSVPSEMMDTGPRKWSAPSSLDGMFEWNSNYSVEIGDFFSGGSSSYLVLPIPQDSLRPPGKTTLRIVQYENGNWRILGEMRDAHGNIFDHQGVAVGNDKLRLFWAGVLPSEQDYYANREQSNSIIGTCLWSNGTCSSPEYIALRSPRYFGMTLIDAIQSNDGSFHVVSKSSQESVYDIRLDQDGQINEREIINDGSFRNLLQIFVHNSETYAVERLSSDEGISFTIRKFEGRWGQRIPILNVSARSGVSGFYESSYSISESGIHRFVFSEFESEHYTLNYTESNDGIEWQSPDSLGSVKHFCEARGCVYWSGKPILAEDERGVTHLSWFVRGNATHINYYASVVDGTWSKLEPLYHDRNINSPIKMSLQEDGVVHRVWIEGKTVFHSILE